MVRCKWDTNVCTSIFATKVKCTRLLGQIAWIVHLSYNTL
jgi:hypothetical protein